jgi:inner membrane protein involved in colicin E2 resistance
MTKRIAALIFIFFCTSVAWMILGATISYRTYHADEELHSRVASTWGTEQSQSPPSAHYSVSEPVTVTKTVNGETVETTKLRDRPVDIPLESSSVNAAFHYDPRQKGLLWYSTYHVAFDGKFNFRNPTEREQNVVFAFPLPAEKAQYDDLNFTLNGQPLELSHNKNFVSAVATLPAGGQGELSVHYLSQGLDRWTYSFGDSVNQVRNFRLDVSTNFQDYDFASNSLSPTNEQKHRGGADLTWQYKDLVSGYPIALVMPQKLQPGPIAERISFFAPVSLFFFFFLLFILCTVRGIDLHPMHYFFLACTFFSFHVLLAYLADHISIHAAFVICSAVSIFLLVTYLRRVVNPRFAVRVAGLIQLIYLVLFSYAFFFEGFTGLAITIGAILTLFIVMQMTATVRWSEKLTVRPA